jgi:hypothetical protein
VASKAGNQAATRLLGYRVCLALGLGALPQAKMNGRRVIRRNRDGGTLDSSLSYDGIAMGSQTRLELPAQDLVYLPMSKFKATLMDATDIIFTAPAGVNLHGSRTQDAAVIQEAKPVDVAMTYARDCGAALPTCTSGVE